MTTPTINPGDTVYLTKYAISRGGSAEPVIVESVSPDGSIKAKGWYDYWLVGRDVALTPAEADSLIEAAVRKKIAQAEKQLVRLRKMHSDVLSRLHQNSNS